MYNRYEVYYDDRCIGVVNAKTAENAIDKIYEKVRNTSPYKNCKRNYFKALKSA